MAGCTGVTSRAEVAAVAQGCTIRTAACGVFQASITVHTSGVWGLHIPSTHRPRRSRPSTSSRRQPRLQHLRYPMSTNATRTRSMGELILLFILFFFSSLRFLRLLFRRRLSIVSPCARARAPTLPRSLCFSRLANIAAAIIVFFPLSRAVYKTAR